MFRSIESGVKRRISKYDYSDQGSQFTSRSWIELLKKRGIEISMDGKGRCIDNIHIERFWRSLKYEEVYLRSYRSIKEAKESLGSYIQFYNEERPHQSLGYKTPNEMHEAESSGKIKCMEALA